MKIAILTRPIDGSPKILAQSLKKQLDKLQVESDIFYEDGGFLMRRVPLFGKFKQKGKIHFTLRRYLRHYFNDKRLIETLKTYDSIVIADCEPNAFWKDHYGIEKFKELLKRPIAFHGVYYLGNVPTHISKLRSQGHPTMERFDWHLAVTGVTEIKSEPRPPWSIVGLNLEKEGLEIGHKKEFFAIVDFKRKGYEKFWEDQIRVLEKLGIPYVAFENRMPMAEIRDYYKRASLIFLSFPETFGVPIAECFSCGTAVFTPSSSWPMSWRLDENPQPNVEGILPKCFVEYSEAEGLERKLSAFYDDWDADKTPKLINSIFLKNYHHFFHGNEEGVQAYINSIKS